jgi:hypothetical protein
MNGRKELDDALTPLSSATSSFQASTSSNVSSPLTSGELSKCRYCKGISLETLSQPGGYKHASSRASLVSSAQKCKLCSLLFRRDRSRKQNDAIYLALDNTGDDDDDQQVCLRVSHSSVDFGDENDLVFVLYTSRGEYCTIFTHLGANILLR